MSPSDGLNVSPDTLSCRVPVLGNVTPVHQVAPGVWEETDIQGKDSSIDPGQNEGPSALAGVAPW